MKTIAIATAILLSALHVYGQTKSDTLLKISEGVVKLKQEVEQKIADDRTKQRFYSQGAYDKYFDKYFTLLSYERESFTDGNSAALKITDNETKLNLTVSHKSNNSIFSVSTGLNIKDKSGTLFTESKPTAGTQFGLSHSQIISQQRFLKFDRHFKKLNYHLRQAVIDSIYYVHVFKRPITADSVLSRLRIVDGLINVLQKTPGGLDQPSKQRLLKLIAEKEKLLPETNSYSILKDAETTLTELRESVKELSVKRELKNEGVTLFRLSWISTGINYQRFNYKTYDSNLAMEDRIAERSFDAVSFTIAYNFYWQRNPAWIKFLNGFDNPKGKGLNSIYASILYSLTRSNNFASIAEQKLTLINSYIQNDTTYQFSSEETLRNISGKEFKTFLAHNIGLQFTGMFGKKQFMGINFVPSWELSNEQDTKFNSRIGALFKFVDSADQKSKVNFELFLSLNDWTNVGDSKKSLWERKSIGLSASVPLQKVFFK